MDRYKKLKRNFPLTKRRLRFEMVLVSNPKHLLKEVLDKADGCRVADETVIDIDGKNIWFWDIIDIKTRFLIASHMSYTRITRDAETLMKQAYNRTGKIPRVIYTYKLRAYLDGIELTFGADTQHRQGSPFDIENKANLIERFHGTIKERTKVMRGLHTVETAKKFLDGWLIHYNYFRPHTSLKDKTPAQMAGIKFPFRNWKDVVEQPYEITARIPIRCKTPRVTKPTPRITPKTPRLTK